MKGIVIFTAGREDAYQDYLDSVKKGVQIEDISSYLSEENIQLLSDGDSNGTARLWGTSVGNQWNKVENGDIVLVYREGEFIARARVVLAEENLQLAKHLWQVEGNPWDENNPWRYLVYVDQFEEISVSLDDFNDLVGYKDNYIPQGFIRVADRRIREIEDNFESLENAIADLTGTGEKVHKRDTDEGSLEKLKSDLIAAGEDGSRSEEFEQLVADAFSRLGCEAEWIEGGSDTDVEIKQPAHVVVEAKSRGRKSGIRNINAAGIVSHQKQRGADHGLIVGRHFAPQQIEDAERNGITTLTTDQLTVLLDKREQYGVPPERVFEYLLQPGAFQEDRQDLLQEHIDSRFEAVEAVLSVLKGVQRSTDPVDAGSLRYILLGMYETDQVPDRELIANSLQFLSHPALQLLEQTESGYTLTTDFQNAIEVISSMGPMIEKVSEEFDSES